MTEPAPGWDAAAFRARLREAIKSSGRRQQEIAEHIDMDPTALSKVLSGSRRLSSLELARFSEATGVTVMTLLWGTPEVDRFAKDLQVGARIRTAHEIGDALDAAGMPDAAAIARGKAVWDD